MWQPIETAPKDGTSILCAMYFPHGGYWGQMVLQWDTHNKGWCDGISWYQYDNDAKSEAPTHWMPLFTPPHLHK